MPQKQDMGLTPEIVRQFGVAFGHWAWQLDLMLHGKVQSGDVDLIAVEETSSYEALLKAIEIQDPPEMVQREIAGRTVWVKNKPSDLYLAMRQAMFDAYRPIG